MPYSNSRWSQHLRDCHSIPENYSPCYRTDHPSGNNSSYAYGSRDFPSNSFYGCPRASERRENLFEDYSYTHPSREYHSNSASRHSRPPKHPSQDYASYAHPSRECHSNASYRPSREKASFGHSRPPQHRRNSSHAAEEVQPKRSRAPRQATAEDLIRAGIPSGYSTKHWDPSLPPFLFMGSAFDYNSFGQWVFDWAMYCRRTQTVDLAEELWYSLIELERVRCATDKCDLELLGAEDAEIIEDFAAANDRLWTRFDNILRSCEEYMGRFWIPGSGGRSTGTEAGVEFVKSMFGEDRLLEETKHFLLAVWTSKRRFDANCEVILEQLLTVYPLSNG